MPGVAHQTAVGGIAPAGDYVDSVPYAKLITGRWRPTTIIGEPFCIYIPPPSRITASPADCEYGQRQHYAIPPAGWVTNREAARMLGVGLETLTAVAFKWRSALRAVRWCREY